MLFFSHTWIISLDAQAGCLIQKSSSHPKIFVSFQFAFPSNLMRKTHAYRQIFYPETGCATSSEHRIWGVDKVFESMEMVRKAEGIKVDVLGDRKGKRQEAPCQKLGVRFPFYLNPPISGGKTKGKYSPGITPGICILRDPRVMTFTLNFSEG